MSNPSGLDIMPPTWEQATGATPLDPLGHVKLFQRDVGTWEGSLWWPHVCNSPPFAQWEAVGELNICVFTVHRKKGKFL